jgi:MFS family permease
MRAISSDRVLSRAGHLYLSFYWLSLNFHWGALLAIVLPIEVLMRSTEATKALYLGLVASVGSLVGMAVQPIAGAFSDRCHLSWGKRRPFILGGALVNAVGLLWMPQAVSLYALSTAFVLVQLGNNVSGAAYQGYIPDHVPHNQRGTASGYMGLMSMVGTIGSFGLAAVLVKPDRTYPFYVVLVLVLLAGVAVTLWKVPDTPASEETGSSRGTSWVESLRNSDFRWLSITRALVMLSQYTMVTFIAYYIRDKIRLSDFVGATLAVAGVALVGSLASALVAGVISDRVGRKGIVCFATLAMAAAFLAFVASPPWGIILAVGALFGLGYGAYTSVDWALAVDILPNPRRAARDLGLWGFSTSLPQTLAPLLGGIIIYHLAASGWGYPAVFLLSALASIAAAGLVWRIRSVA